MTKEREEGSSARVGRGGKTPSSPALPPPAAAAALVIVFSSHILSILLIVIYIYSHDFMLICHPNHRKYRLVVLHFAHCHRQFYCLVYHHQVVVVVVVQRRSMVNWLLKHRLACRTMANS